MRASILTDLADIHATLGDLHALDAAARFPSGDIRGHWPRRAG